MNHSDRPKCALVRVAVFAAAGLMVASGVWADGFEPFSPRAIARKLGIGSGPGYHAYPCNDFQAHHFNRAVTGQMHPRAYTRHRFQTPAVPPVMPYQQPLCSGCYDSPGGDYGAQPYPDASPEISTPLHQAPATLDGTIEPAPLKSTVIAPTEEPTTRAHQGSTAPPRDEPTRAPEEVRSAPTPPQTQSPFQYDPRSPAPESPPTTGSEPATGLEGEFDTPTSPEEVDLLEPEGLEDLPAPTTGRTDPKVWW